MLTVVGNRRWTALLSFFLGGCLGLVITGILITLFYTTNYWFANPHIYHLDAYVMGMAYHKRNPHNRLSISKYEVNIRFLDSEKYFCLDDPEAYKEFNQGDTVRVSLCKGLYGISIIKDLDLKD